MIEQIVARRPGYTPEWQATEKRAGTGLACIVARYLEAAIQRLNQTPAKNKLAFLDLAGLNLSAAQAARAPVVFQLGEKATGGSVPARTAIAAALRSDDRGLRAGTRSASAADRPAGTAEQADDLRVDRTVDTGSCARATAR